MDEETHWFKYEDLDKGGQIRPIRLIRLEPEGLTRPAGFVIDTFGISKAPEYYALSYCWGTPDRLDFVTCNGARLAVTPQLKGGLQELLLIPRLRTWFWIDQICINQGDLEEQSHQVQLMTQIYGGALRTVVWLGTALGLATDTEEEDYAQASEFASNIYNIGQTNPWLSFEPVLQAPKLRPGGWSGRLPAARALQTTADLDRWNLPSLADRRWGALCAVFLAPWFSRVWVIREVFASREEPIVVRHGRCHGFLHLLWAGYFISQNFQLLGQSDYVKCLTAAESSLSHTRLLLQLAIGKMDWTLEGILWRTVAYGATRPVDKFFAVVDLVSRDLPTPTDLPAPTPGDMEISPNYFKSLADVGRDFTRHVLKNSPSLLILSLINHDEMSISRCPDGSSSWAYMPSDNADPSLLMFGHVRTILLTHRTGYYPKRQGHNVGSNYYPHVAPKQDPSMLTLRGGKVGGLQAVPQRSMVSKAKLWHWIEFAYEIRYADQPCEDLDFFLKDFFRTITAQEDYRGRDTGPTPDDFYLWLEEHVGQTNADLGSTQASSEAFLDRFFQRNKLPIQKGDARVFQRWNEKYETGPSRHRQFGIMNDGAMVLGPRNMSAGDVVCSFDGGELAYILRPRGHQYLFLGECFVHVLCQGGWNRDGIVMKQWFTLV
ncbi:heterokaryon incompatibility protein-domain-containing protein [Stachybotrys elegans]|uniref:Heterokaryon incompatibility protein-domain-containing protein n=1 Tax=Stachybotrys elegans TaxID=80388 RepID=A0A8K0SMP2_9HYPO|nr:heterokaryon incompatibility protein-domain-containing protein [Stachybotrys elegans]